MTEEYNYTFQAIGVVRTREKYRFEAPRQGVFSQASGVIELFPGFGGDAIADLQGFDRIWVIFCFHLNLGKGWKSRVHPPVVPEKRAYSLFATRSPHRVNPIGMSCVELLEVRQRELVLGNIDMLDGTPVLDIKPYIPEADAFPESRAGWRDAVKNQGALCAGTQIVFQENFRVKAEFLRQHGAPDMENFCRVQLSEQPLNRERKRLYPGRFGGRWELGCRTWRIEFSVDPAQTVTVWDIYSNYPAEELAAGTIDRYGDKDIHRAFAAFFA